MLNDLKEKPLPKTTSIMAWYYLDKSTFNLANVNGRVDTLTNVHDNVCP